MRRVLLAILTTITAALLLATAGGPAAADVDGADHDEVLFKADDGVRVFADLYVVEAGYNVLVVDQRSGGSQFGGAMLPCSTTVYITNIETPTFIWYRF
jgi:hypothetical protein